MKKLNAFIILLLGFTINYSQSTVKKADKDYSNLSYPKAIKAYKKFDLSDLTTNDLRNLAIAYKLTDQTDSAEVYYALLSQKEDNQPEDLFQYAQVLLMNNKSEKAEVWMKNFNQRLTSDGRGNEYVSQANTINKLKEDLGKYTVFSIDANSKMHDFSPTFYLDKVVFTSARKSKLPAKFRWNWNNQPFLNLYEATINENLQFIDVTMMSKKYNKKYHDGPASYSADGKLMVFNRNNYGEKNDKGERKLKMFYREKNDDGEWGDIIGFKFNNKNYSVGHPAVSSDGNTVYFVSDMPGGKGSTDIYKITRVEGRWSDPINLGESINTEGREMFPFVHDDDMLFFASDGQVGIGGLDLFVAKVDGSKFSNIQNLGYPVNSIKDDFGLILDKKQTYGYFSSNRDGGKGSDDIYGFKLLKPFNFCKEIKGIASDNNGNVLPKATIKLINKDNVIETVITDDNGNFYFCVQPSNYKLIGSKEKYFDGYNVANPLESSDDPITANVILEKDPGFSLVAIVKDNKTKANLEGVKVIFENKLESNKNEKITNANGEAGEPLKGIRLNEGISYVVTFSKEGYLPKTVPFTKKLSQPGKQQFDVFLDQIPNFTLYALVTDKETNEPIEGVEITLIDNITNTQEKLVLPETGDLTKGIVGKKMNDNISYRFILKKDGYLTKELTYNKKLTREGKYEAHLELDFTMDPLLIGGDLSKLIDINPINFDLGKYNIRPDAAVELDKIVQVMNEYPGMWIELGAHTDCRGSKAFNESLSDKRAKSSADYIKSKITNPERIFGKGYGENRLLNKCECEGSKKVPCTESEHDINRRTEFRITKMEVKGVEAKANGPQSFDK